MIEILLGILGLAGSILGLIGWFVKKSVLLLLIGFVLSLFGLPNYRGSVTILGLGFWILIIGFVIGAFIKTPFWVCGIIPVLAFNFLVNEGGIENAVQEYKDRK